MAMILALMENDRELINILLVAGMGALAVITYWRIGTPLLLLGLVVLEVFHRLNRPWYAGLPGADDSPFMDAVLCAAVLASARGGSSPSAVAGRIRPSPSTIVGRRRPGPPARRPPAAA